MKLTRVSNYDRAFLLSFFQPLRFTIAIDAIIEGAAQGIVWMDNPSNPTLVVLWDFADGVYAISLEKTNEYLKALRTLFQKEIIPESERLHEDPVFVIYIFPECDENEARNLFNSGWNVSKQIASFYEFPLAENPMVPKGKELPLSLEGNFMDIDLLKDTSIRNIGTLLEEIESDWGSIEYFLRYSFGYYIRDLAANTLASWVLVEKKARSCAEFAIETVEQYRRQGLAQLAAREMIKHSLEQELVPHWYCFQNNVPSVKMVEKMGFQKMKDFKVHVVEKL